MHGIQPGPYMTYTLAWLVPLRTHVRASSLTLNTRKVHAETCLNSVRYSRHLTKYRDAARVRNSAESKYTLQLE